VPHHREENDNQKNPAFRRRLKRVMMVNWSYQILPTCVESWSWPCCGTWERYT